MQVLALNRGSSSLKFGFYCVADAGIEALLSGPAASIAEISERLRAASLPMPQAIGHRIVHGGASLRKHCRIDSAVLRRLQDAADFAPLHTAAALEGIRYCAEHFPGLPQVACIDTCFHSAMPEVARVLPISGEGMGKVMQRYGFHGLSCESIVEQLRRQPRSLPRRLVIAHLGHGASLTAVKDGRSIDTTMGLTPSGGLIMGTRSGDLDPGVLLYLMREQRFDAAMLGELIDHRSGLLGISGVSSDMRRLHEAAAGSPGARLAIDMFCYAVRKQLAAMAAALEGIDLLVFTGGIGENDAAVRTAICAGLAWILPAAAVQVLPSREEEQIARHTAALA